MILVDTSVWIELLNGKLGQHIDPDDVTNFVTCGPVAQEVLQGLRPGAQSEAFHNAFRAIPRLSDPLPWEAFLEAAEIYRQGGRKGYTIRSGVDCLIAAIAIRNAVPVWHQDRDFSAISSYTSLEAWGGHF